MTSIEKDIKEKVNELFNEQSVSEAIKLAQEILYKPYPKSISKPCLIGTHTSDDAKQYASDLKEYEYDIKLYNKQKNEVVQANVVVDYYIEKQLKEISGLISEVPEDKQAKVWSRAWEEGHSAGYYEVYLCLCNLIELFT
jgi:hypothetical protein